MKKYDIGLVFKSEEESNAWIEEFWPNRTYNGEIIFTIQRTINHNNGETTIDYITTI